MEKIGRDIVKKCERLPLAISVLGGILKHKTSLEEWEMLSNNISKYLRIGEEREEDQDSVIYVLGLSYKELPYYLKPCFLYFACFPEDSEIEVEELCLLWIGEGFVYSSHVGEGETMKDVARQYLNELAQRSMVMLIRDEFTGSVETCRLHDLMREMCILQGKKDDFFAIIDYQRTAQNPCLVISPDSCSRRLALSFTRSGDVEIPRKQNDAVRRISSLILRCPKRGKIELNAPCIREFRFLRALVVKGDICFQYKDLERISELIHLRLLIFKHSHVTRFPPSISTLQYLETLNLEVWNSSVIIPNNLGRMKQLRHLFLPEKYGVEGGEKLRLDGLVNLELLSKVNSTRCRVEDIGKLNRLRTIRAYFNEDGSDEVLSNFSWPALHDLAIDGPIPGPDGYLRFSSSLTKIILRMSNLKEDPMKTLEKLPNLQTLELRFKSFVGEEMVCSTEGFPQLKTLMLSELTNLKKWEVEDGAMPMLHFLVIDYCSDLEMIPDGFRFLKALKQLVIRGMYNIEERIGVEGEDFEKVQHVPSITCYI